MPSLSDRDEMPGLLEPGFHPMTLADLRRRCVEAFPLSRTRERIMDGLERAVAMLIAADVVGELWIDGSFLTERVNPKDSDVVLRMEASVYDGGTDEMRAAADSIEHLQSPPHHCDGYLLVEEFPPGHPQHHEWKRALWIRQFGFDRNDDPKGMALIKLAQGET